VATGAMISSGLFILPGLAFAKAGPPEKSKTYDHRKSPGKSRDDHRKSRVKSRDEKLTPRVYIRKSG